MAHSHDSTTLDLPLPARRHQTLGLVLVRRIAGHGLHDARATMLALDASGAEFRRLLVLTRALVVDLARTSRRKILLAPCCAARAGSSGRDAPARGACQRRCSP